MTEFGRTFEMWQKKCEEIDNKFDTAEEGIEYSYDRRAALKEEFDNLEVATSRLSDIISAYSSYRDCLVDYIVDKYSNLYNFLIVEFIVLISSFIIIMMVNMIVFKLLFVLPIIILVLYDYKIFMKVKKMRKKIADNLYKRHKIDLMSLTEEDMCDIDMTGLRNKMRQKKIVEEIEAYEYYISWKNRQMGNEYFYLESAVEWR